MSGYMGLSDLGGEDCPFDQTTCAMKFCSMGFVTSKHWTTTHLVITNGVIRVYDSEVTYKAAPLSFAEEITLTRVHSCSPIKRKEYVQNGGKPLDFFCFYLEEESQVINGNMRILKIACYDHDVAQRIINTITNTCNMVSS